MHKYTTGFKSATLKMC